MIRQSITTLGAAQAQYLSQDTFVIPEVTEHATPEEVVVVPQPKMIEAVELRVTYTVATISARAKSFDRQFQVTRTQRFETIVMREMLRNPTKLRVKLLAQAHNHFRMMYNTAPSSNPYLALPESIKITNVMMLGHKEFPV